MGFLNVIFNLSITGSIMLLMFLLIEPITKKHFNSSWHYKMLILVLIFFILPVNGLIKLPVKPINNFVRFNIEKPTDQQNINYELKNQVSIEKETTRPRVLLNEQEARTYPKQIDGEKEDFKSFSVINFKEIALCLWIVGVITLLFLKLVPFLRFKSFILKNSNQIEDKDILILFNECKEELKLIKRIELLTCGSAVSPMLIGMIRPIILIPENSRDYKRLKMILKHELCHYKRKDIIIKALRLIINAIHWFNPLIFILSKEMDKLCEYSVDEMIVEEMNMENRKYYAETILNVASSISKATLSTAMGNGGKELKSRLENIIYSFKTTRKKGIVSIFTAILILISSLAVSCSILPENSLKDNNPFVVYIKEDGLYYSYLNAGKEIEIHKGEGFEYPLISSEGSYIAYTKGDSFYIYSVKDKSYEKIDDGIEHYYRSYDWIDDKTIIYGSDEKPGFTVYNVTNKNRKQHADNNYYTGLVSSKNKVYGRKSSKLTKAEGDFIQNEGIVEININNYDDNNKLFSTDLIIKAAKSTDESIGDNPVVWDISEDGRFVYIMKKWASGSLSSDGIGFGVYDLSDKTYKEFEDIVTLSYKDNLALNSNNIVALIQGAGRDMVYNKKVALLNIHNDKSYDVTNITNDDLAAKTPSFTLDGKKLLFSAAKTLDIDKLAENNKIYDNMEDLPLGIYEYNLESSELKVITEGKSFDFKPISISNDEIMFIRLNGEGLYSLIKLVKGKETVIASNIVFKGGRDNSPFEYYGHIDTEKGMDIKIAK